MKKIIFPFLITLAVISLATTTVFAKEKIKPDQKTRNYVAAAVADTVDTVDAADTTQTCPYGIDCPNNGNCPYSDCIYNGNCPEGANCTYDGNCPYGNCPNNGVRQGTGRGAGGQGQGMGRGQGAGHHAGAGRHHSGGGCGRYR